jgi:glutathione reductase (NADPH)
VLVDEETDRVVGAHLVGPHAEQAINLFAMAIRHNIPSARLRDTILAYPTAASDIAHML